MSASARTVVTFPSIQSVACVVCGTGVPRNCQSPADLRWTCPYCLMGRDFTRTPRPDWRVVYDDSIRYAGRDRSIVSAFGKAVRGFQPMKPRELDSSQRHFPRWTRDEGQFKAVCEALRPGENGPQNVAIAYWYWRAGIGIDEIAGLLRLAEKAEERSLPAPPLPSASSSVPGQESAAYWERLLREAMQDPNEAHTQQLRRLVQKRIVRIRETARAMGFHE